MMKIQLVDDEPFVLKLLARQLANLGFDDVSLHERAADALAHLQRSLDEIELIFCDLQMPEMDGVEFVRQLAAIGYSGGLVLVSGEDERILQSVRTLAQSHRLNVLGALHKPIAPDQLKRYLQHHADTIRAKAPDEGPTYQRDDIQQAITGRELVNHYQPKVDIHTGTVIGVETLVRWQHPRDGLVYPDRFIAVAEQHGLIDALTQVVLEQALRQAERWQRAGLALHVAVNVSMSSLYRLDFPDRVSTAITTAGIDPTWVVLEVTESQIMEDPRLALDICSRLRLKHISLAIDDFGTGHSSLSQLRDIPFDELKIDQGFVHNASEEPSRRAILEASIELAQKLRLRSVAEGVENRADWDFLRGLGCDLAQGHFIARPMPAAELMDWVSHWKRTFQSL